MQTIASLSGVEMLNGLAQNREHAQAPLQAQDLSDLSTCTGFYLNQIDAG
jgi:hypothetical protein